MKTPCINLLLTPNFDRLFAVIGTKDSTEGAYTLSLRSSPINRHFADELLFGSEGRPEISLKCDIFCSKYVKMACIASLKQELKLAESLFGKDNERFQIHKANMDELMCKFVGSSDEEFVIHCNFTVSG